MDLKMAPSTTTTSLHTTRTLTSLPSASRDLILSISTDLSERMERLMTSGRIAAIDVIPIAKDILDLSTLRCLVEEKRCRRNTLRKRDRSGSITTVAAAPTWEEMDDHVCACHRASRMEAVRACNQERRRLRKERRSWVSLRGRRRRAEEDAVVVECQCSRALDLMDLEGDILRSFPDDSGDTLVAPELAQWAIGHLKVEAEQTNRLVDSLLWVDADESEDASSGKSARVDSMEPEGRQLAKSTTSKSSKSGKGGSPGGRRVRGWWKSDVDDEGDVEDIQREEKPDRRSGQMFSIHICQRKRSRVFSVLRSFSLH